MLASFAHHLSASCNNKQNINIYIGTSKLYLRLRYILPASLSIGTLHIGHRLILSSKLSNSNKGSMAAGFTLPSVLLCKYNFFPFSWQVKSGCQLLEHMEQNSFSHFGQLTARALILWFRVVELAQIWQIVLQPGFGHQARLASRATSVFNLKTLCFSTKSLETRASISRNWKMPSFSHAGSGQLIS